MFSKEKRCQYENHQLAEVICQLRFPEILTIGANAPVDFQEAIRSEYPRYAARNEAAAPKISGTPGNLQLENQKPTVNYQFMTADGQWRVNLTSTFVSLATNTYTGWEDFANKLDIPLAALIRVYKPAYFERIGLRYMNFFSRENLQMTDTPFSELFEPAYLGLLADDEVNEAATSRISMDYELAIPGGCRAKIHAGPGLVKRSGQQDKEIKFILDLDLYMNGNVPVNYSAGALETIHSQAYPIFRGAITEKLHDAMSPEDID